MGQVDRRGGSRSRRTAFGPVAAGEIALMAVAAFRVAAFCLVLRSARKNKSNKISAWSCVLTI